MASKLIVSEETRKILDKETADFYLRMAEKKLKSLVDISNRITDRGYLLASLLVAILTGISWALTKELNSISVISSFIGLLVCGACLVILVLKVICVHTIWTLGREPSKMNIDAFVSYYHQLGDDILVNVIADELNPIEEKILLNQQNIRQRARYFNWCFRLILSGVCMELLLFLVYFLF